MSICTDIAKDFIPTCQQWLKNLLEGALRTIDQGLMWPLPMSWHLKILQVGTHDYLSMSD